MSAVQDPGLQAERTRLAWSRTALATAALGALLLHGARSPVGLVCGGAVLLTAAGVLLRGIGRYRHIRRAVAAGRSVVDGSGSPMGLLVLLPAAAALIAVLTH
ncbi:DUF202 domain-containing protein [Actinokineospora spheciospongiae]|uniref:DUF202 domain-containing protein n=1 Tax=Actinokineospora spheciospongiae TaxID=909613 RepID=UPI000D70FD7E|nr:DUF202 domain-containing protein [Actinokineospora spheciospongiae]PWW56301.1 uncharacterized protein DUF202 [Actinokineospora spheciospongiae]